KRWFRGRRGDEAPPAFRPAGCVTTCGRYAAFSYTCTKSRSVTGKFTSSDFVKGSTPRTSSSRATRIAKQSESRPEFSNTRSSDRGASLIFCSSAIFCISDVIVNFALIVCPPVNCLVIGIFFVSIKSRILIEHGQCQFEFKGALSPGQRLRCFRNCRAPDTRFRRSASEAILGKRA